jgi:hypothetical protein
VFLEYERHVSGSRQDKHFTQITQDDAGFEEGESNFRNQDQGGNADDGRAAGNHNANDGSVRGTSHHAALCGAAHDNAIRAAGDAAACGVECEL